MSATRHPSHAFDASCRPPVDFQIKEQRSCWQVAFEAKPPQEKQKQEKRRWTCISSDKIHWRQNVLSQTTSAVGLSYATNGVNGGPSK